MVMSRTCSTLTSVGKDSSIWLVKPSLVVPRQVCAQSSMISDFCSSDSIASVLNALPMVA